MWASLFALGGGKCITCSLRFTSGVAPADLRQPAWQPSLSLSHTCKQALVGFETQTYVLQMNALTDFKYHFDNNRTEFDNMFKHLQHFTIGYES